MSKCVKVKAIVWRDANYGVVFFWGFFSIGAGQRSKGMLSLLDRLQTLD